MLRNDDAAWDLSLNSDAPPRNSNIEPKKPSVKHGRSKAKRERAPIYQRWRIQLLRHRDGQKHAKSLSGCSSCIWDWRFWFSA
ncbi:unnamed protein product, partial [Mesorhabditis belari]|uniref:Uncharacterized protein n=1 Tax=Mesorhabditis belari TaxID=2138241 RepID=A0AAF3FBQ3_9BILA